jgi:hypothetical protein
MLLPRIVMIDGGFMVNYRSLKSRGETVSELLVVVVSIVERNIQYHTNMMLELHGRI